MEDEPVAAHVYCKRTPPDPRTGRAQLPVAYGLSFDLADVVDMKLVARNHPGSVAFNVSVHHVGEGMTSCPMFRESGANEFPAGEPGPAPVGFKMYGPVGYVRPAVLILKQSVRELDIWTYGITVGQAARIINGLLRAHSFEVRAWHPDRYKAVRRLIDAAARVIDPKEGEDIRAVTPAILYEAMLVKHDPNPQPDPDPTERPPTPGRGPRAA